jgi:hypothetical protein
MIPGAQPAIAAPRTRCFPETNHCVSDPILAYWERGGGLVVFGYPISDLQNETVESWTGPVQWFERDRLEDHGPLGVLAGRLGARLLELQGRPWETLARVNAAPPNCQFFAETGHSLCGVFLSYWRAHGGLERFGYPISEPIEETPENLEINWTGTVQYFERRRMEHHLENSGTAYEVLLGLLGSTLYQSESCAEAIAPLQATAAAYRSVIGCTTPGTARGDIALAEQPFERGTMVWVAPEDPHHGLGTIYVVFVDAARGALAWQSYPDTWEAGEPDAGGEAPPPNRYAPIRGFGKLWRSDGQMRSRLGWAMAPEHADVGAQLYFRGGAQMLYRMRTDRVYVLYPDNHAEDIARIP